MLRGDLEGLSLPRIHLAVFRCLPRAFGHGWVNLIGNKLGAIVLRL